MAVKLPGDGCDLEATWDPTVETASPAETRAAAEAAWTRQLDHLRADSADAAARLKDAGVGAGSTLTLSELHQVPFSTKQDLRAALDADPPFGTNLGVAPGRVKRVYQTSGTTGTPSLVALTAADVETWTEIGARSYYATGIHPHNSVLSTFGAGPFVVGHTHQTLARLGCRTVPVGPGDTGRVLAAIRSGIVDTLLATASFAQYLANQVAAGEAPVPAGLTHVITGGEPGGGIPETRNHLEIMLGATVTEVMGIGDVAPSLFGECPAQQGMHFCGAGLVWPELVDPESRASIGIEAGAIGEIVYTHLAREAMPVLRFLSGDIVRIEGTACVCGRTGFRLRCLGRRDDMFIVRGVNVYPSAILAVVAGFRPALTGRARVLRQPGDISVAAPVPIEVELAASSGSGSTVSSTLAAEVETAIRSRLGFRSHVRLVPETEFGDSAYKTQLAVAEPAPDHEQPGGGGFRSPPGG